MRLRVLWIALPFLVSVTESTDSRSVNLAIEASVLLKPEVLKKNTMLLGKIRKFLDQLGQAFEPKRPNYRRIYQNGVIKTFFIQLSQTVLKYDDKHAIAFKKAIANFADIFLKGDREFSKFLYNRLKYLGALELHDFKNRVQKFVNNKDVLANVLFDLCDQVYKENEDDGTILEHILERFQKHPKTEHIDSIIYDAFKFILDKYEDLSAAEQAKFDSEIEKMNRFTSPSGINEKHREVKNEDDKIDREIENNDIGKNFVLDQDIVINVGTANRGDNPTTRNATNEII